MRTAEYRTEKLQKFNFYAALFLIVALMFLMNYHLFAQDGTEWGKSAGTIKTAYSFINIEKKNTPAESMLYQNFPNPCFNSTTIKFDISNQTDAKLSIYDISGNEVKSYLYTNIKSGSYEIKVDASMLYSGEYTYKFTAGAYYQEYKMNVVK